MRLVHVNWPSGESLALVVNQNFWLLLFVAVFTIIGVLALLGGLAYFLYLAYGSFIELLSAIRSLG